jgi:hypothetical protein
MSSRLPFVFRLAFLALGALAASLVVGCVHPSYYVVTPTSRETVSEKLDAHWFQREVADAQGLKYIELVYCPVQAGEAAPVCRTSIIWTRGRSQLLPN